MDQFKENFKSTMLQPQIFTLLLTVLILVVFAVVVYRKVKKQEINKAPEGILLFAEQYVKGFDNLYADSTEGKVQKPAPYVFTLASFLMIANIMGLVGLESPTTSYSVTLVLGLITWIGIYVVGVTYQKLSFFKKFANPVELIGQFSPLISISFRLFGNIIGGSVIMYLLYHVTGYWMSSIPVIGEINIIGPIFTPLFHAYFDIFDGLIQALVFTMLTMIYWTLEAETPEPKVKKIKKIKNKKQLKNKSTVSA